MLDSVSPLFTTYLNGTELLPDALLELLPEVLPEALPELLPDAPFEAPPDVLPDVSPETFPDVLLFLPEVCTAFPEAVFLWVEGDDEFLSE